jgi:hypothetical protein
MARCGYTNLNCADFTPKIQVPQLEALGSDPIVLDSLKRLLQKLFIVKVPHFEEGGKLRGVLKICMATMIMYHPCVKSEAGASNEVVLKLNRAAREAAIGDSRFSVFSPESILIEWATIITKDVEQRRKQANLARPDLESVTATLNHTLSLVSAMAEDL